MICSKIHAKRGAAFVMPVKFTGIDLDNVSQIEFVFKQTQDERGDPLKYAVYNSVGTSEVTRHATDETVLLIPWEEGETYLFSPLTNFYMDTKIHMIGSDYMPLADIVALTMHPTLFEEVITDDNG